MDVLSAASFIFGAIKKVIIIAKKHKNDNDFNSAINANIDKLVKEYFSLFDFSVMFSIEDFFEKYVEQILNDVDISRTVESILMTVNIKDSDFDIAKEFLVKLGEIINDNYLVYYGTKETKAAVNVVISKLTTNNISEKDKTTLSNILSKLFNEGNYRELRSLLLFLKKYNELEEIYFKYLLLYCCVCDEGINYCVSSYLDIANTTMVSDIFETLIKYNKIETINKYKYYLPNQYENFVSLMNNGDMDQCFEFINSIDNEKIKNTWIICLFNKTVFSDQRKTYGFSFENIKEFPFHLKVIINSIPALNSIREGTISIRHNLDISFSSDGVEPMNDSYKELYYLSKIYKCDSTEELETTISQIHKDYIKLEYVKDIIIYKKIMFKEKIDIDEVIYASNSLNCGKLLFLYLTTFMEIDETHEFLRNNKSLMLKHSYLYVMYLKILIQKNKMDELKRFLIENKSMSNDINIKIASLCVFDDQVLLNEIQRMLIDSCNYHYLDFVLLILVANYTAHTELIYDICWNKLSIDQQLSENIMYMLFANKNYDQSFLLSLCDQFIKTNPNSSILLLYSGMLSEMQKDYFDALDKYESSFRIEHNLNAAIKWLNCSLSNKGDYEENDIISYCSNSINSDAQLLVSDFYLGKNDIEKSITHLINSYLLGCTNLKGIGSIAFRIATYHYATIDGKKSVSPNTCVYLFNQKSNSEIRVCIYKRNKITKNVECFEKDGMFHFFDDDKEVGGILYSKKKEKVLFNGDTYVVSQIESVIIPFHNIGMDLFIKSGDAIAFSSQDPKESVKQLINYFNDINKQSKKRISRNLSLIGSIPLEAIAKNMGKLLVELIIFSQHYYDTFLYLNDSEVKEKYDKVIVSFDACVLLSQLDFDLAFLKNKAVIPFTVKNKILKECRELLNEIEIDNDSGFLFFDDNNNIGYHKTNSKDKRSRRDFINKLIELTNVFDCESKKNNLNNDEFTKILKSINDECSADTISTAQKYNAPLFTDDIFLAKMAIYNSAKTFGITQFIIDSNTDINIIKTQLIKLTEINYFPVINKAFLELISLKHSSVSIIKLIEEILSYNYNIDKINKRISEQKNTIFKLQ